MPQLTLPYPPSPALPPLLTPDGHTLRIGVAGWDYPDWQGVVYPPKLKGTDRLTFLAGWFNAVEINVTFYRFVAASLAERWLEAVAAFPDFRFTAKLWQRFTHERQMPPDDLAVFRAGLEPLRNAGRLAALLAQFPYSFHHDAQAQDYLLGLKEAWGDFPLTVEVRHRSWQQDAVRQWFTDNGLDFCNIDEPQVSYSLGATRWITGPRAYLRCHGRRRETWFDFGQDRDKRYDYLYSPAELDDLAGRVRELTEHASQTYAIFNNHPAGQAVANALELAHRLLGQRLPAPPTLLAAFPRLNCLTE
jgi:uncharacterized protein YecE (DUF72 family)